MKDILRKAIERELPQINNYLDKLLPSENAPPEIVHKAMRYSVFSGGKRLRPLMTIESFRWAGGSGDEIYPFACAIEIIHAYSLIHDDLPAMDDDDFRRNKPTCHKVFGEAIAILAGDALHALAFEILARSGKVEIVEDVAKAIGTYGLVGGQVADIEFEGCDVSEGDVRFIHERKTGALFTAAVRVGAIFADADENALNAITNYAKNVGLAFQITDDLLDLKGNLKKKGSNIYSDLKLDKATYPRAVGKERAFKIAEKLVQDAKKVLPDDRDNELLNAIADFVLERTY
ncbi:polyprenyl synthetase family protein [bacterium]|nr:polyprenyl synthetase family protein [bacterium]